MQLFHKDFGYVDVIECYKDYSNGHYFLSIRNKDNEIKRFYLDIAFGKTIFLTNECCCQNSEKEIEKFFNGRELYNELVENYGFQGFMHQTSINNLPNILREQKLLSRGSMDSFYDVANHDVLDHTSNDVKQCVRFYFYPKTPTNFRFEEENPGDMIYLVFKWNTLFLENALLFDGNSSSNYSRSMHVATYFEERKYFMDWRTIFERGPINAINEIDKMDTKRKRNAELNVPGFVSLENLECIYVKDINQYNIVKNILEHNMMSNFLAKLMIKPDCFC